MPKKKITMKEAEKVINLLINQVELLKQRANRIEYITEVYHEYKEEKDEFVKYLKDRIEKDNKNRAKSSVPDKRQKDLPESKSSSKA